MRNRVKKLALLVAVTVAFSMLLAGCGDKEAAKYTFKNESENEIKAVSVKADGEKDFGDNLIKDQIKNKEDVEISVKDDSKPVDLQLTFKDDKKATFEKVDLKDMNKAVVKVKDDALVLAYESKKDGKEKSIKAKDFKVEAKKPLAEDKAAPKEEEKANTEESEKSAESSAAAESNQQAETHNEPAPAPSQPQQAPAQDNSGSNQDSGSNTEGCLSGDALLN